MIRTCTRPTFTTATAQERRPSTRGGLALLISLGLLAAACGPDAAGGPGAPSGPGNQPQAGHAFLTIVGDQNVFLDGGTQQTLTVKYHDDQGAPLAGSIHFALMGDAKGSTISTTDGVTDSEGKVQIDLFGGATASAFQVTADAAEATQVDWRIAVAVQPPKKPLDVTGSYAVESQFDLVSGLPGPVGTVVNTFVDMTNGPNDPATWFIDLAESKIGNSTVTSIVDALRPGLDSYLNDFIKSNAPQFVQTIITVGNQFGQVTKKFGLVSQLDIAAGGPDPGDLRAKHTVTGVIYTIDGTAYPYTMADLQLGNPEADGIACTMTGETSISIADHTLPVSYGHFILFALDNVIIPNLDPFAHNLADLLNDNLDCSAIGQTISDYVGIGSPGLYTSACQTGIAAASALVENEILSIDNQAAAFTIHGAAKPVDTNGDRTVDKLQGGLWEGELSFGPLTSTLAKPNQKFAGNRMPIP